MANIKEPCEVRSDSCRGSGFLAGMQGEVRVGAGLPAPRSPARVLALRPPAGRTCVLFTDTPPPLPEAPLPLEAPSLS